MFICLSEPEGIWVFWEYLCVGDSWAELYKLTPVSITSGLNQIPLLCIEDMSTDTASSGVKIYQPSSATLDLRTFLRHLSLIHTVYVVCNDVFHQNHTEAFNLTPKWLNSHLFPSAASLFVGVGRVFAALLNPLVQRNHQGRGEKGQATHWLLIHDSALKVSTFKSNRPASRRRGAAVLPRATQCHWPALRG